MHSYIDQGSGALVFAPSPEQIQINELKGRVEKLENLLRMILKNSGVDPNAFI